jgi:flagellar export protein FliJ
MALRFRLARVLGLRTRLRRLAEDDVARTSARLAALDEEAAGARRAGEECRRATEAAVQAGLTGEDLGRWGTWEASLRAREAALVEEGRQVAETLARGRETVRARRRDERQIERLRERAAARADAEEARGEDRLLDELARRRGRRQP